MLILDRIAELIWYSAWKRRSPLNTSYDKVTRWREYDILDSRDGHRGHTRYWTEAPGVWVCKDCHEWFRTWKQWPQRPELQDRCRDAKYGGY